MSFFIGAFILICCGTFGCKKYFFHVKRTRVLEDILGFLRFSTAEITNYKTGFSELTQKYFYKTNEFRNAILNKDNLRVSWLLLKEEIVEYNGIFNSFFSLGYAELIDRIKSIEQYFNHRLAVERVEGAKNGKLSLKMSLLLGFAAMILII